MSSHSPLLYPPTTETCVTRACSSLIFLSKNQKKSEKLGMTLQHSVLHQTFWCPHTENHWRNLIWSFSVHPSEQHLPPGSLSNLVSHTPPAPPTAGQSTPHCYWLQHGEMSWWEILCTFNSHPGRWWLFSVFTQTDCEPWPACTGGPLTFLSFEAKSANKWVIFRCRITFSCWHTTNWSRAHTTLCIITEMLWHTHLYTLL